jgi:hypothetical protein
MHVRVPDHLASIRSARYTCAMPECPVCRQEFDARFQVFAPPGHEPFDTVECARRAVRTAGADDILAPTLLPTIELFPIARPPAVASPAPSRPARRRLAAAVAVPLVASPAAVAAGLSLVAAGTATSLYLWSPALDKVGQVLAAAPPAQPSEQGDASEGHAPPSSSPVPGGAEDEPETAGVDPLADARLADTIAQAKSDAAEDGPAVTVEAAPPSSTEPDDPPASHGRPVSPGEASPSHPQPPPPAPAGPKSQPSPPPPSTTAPPDAAGELPPQPPTSASPPPAPSSHRPRSVTGSPAAQPPETEEPLTGKKPKPNSKKGATPAVPAVPADGKERRDEPKPRSSPAATPAVPAVPASEQDTSGAGDGGSAGSVGSGGGQGNAGEERGNGNGNGNGNGKKP